MEDLLYIVYIFDYLGILDEKLKKYIKVYSDPIR